MDFSKITAGIVHIYNNVFNNIASHTIAINPSTHIIMEGNVKVTAVGSILNYVGTSNSGTATISGTTVTFNHELIKTPTGVWASFSSTAITGWTWTATSTQITITVTPTGVYTVYWYAEYKP
jgi:pectate lyase